MKKQNEFPVQYVGILADDVSIGKKSHQKAPGSKQEEENKRKPFPLYV